MITIVDPTDGGEEENKNKTTLRKRTLYCINCGKKEADYIVGILNVTLCRDCWDVVAPEVLRRRSIKEEEELT